MTLRASLLLCCALLLNGLTSTLHADLMALYRFDSEESATTDSSISAADTLTLNNGAAWNSSGKYGGALSLDGGNDFASAADSAELSITGDITIAFWMFWPGSSTPAFDHWRGVISKDPTGSGNPAPYQFWFNQGPDYIPSFGRGDGTTSNFVQGTAPPNPDDRPALDAWQHWAITQEGTSVTIYRDGVVVHTGTISVTPVDQGGEFLIGDRHDSANFFFGGRLDDVAIFDEALNLEEVTSIMGGDFTTYGVPEPSQALLLAIGALGAVLVRRRRK